MDNNQLKLVYKDTVDYVTGFLRRKGIESPELEDLIQEIYIEAFKSIHSLKDSSKIRSWIVTIASRKIANHWRQKMRARIVPESDDIISNTSSDKITQDQQSEIKSQVQKIWEFLLEQNPETKRDVLILFFWEGYSLQEIQNKTGTKISTLTTWCSRFRELIKKNMGSSLTC